MKEHYYIFVLEGAKFWSLGRVFANNHSEAIWSFKNTATGDIEKICNSYNLIAAPVDCFLIEAKNGNEIVKMDTVGNSPHKTDFGVILKANTK